MATIEQRLKALEAASPNQDDNVEKQCLKAFCEASCECRRVIKKLLPHEPKYIGNSSHIDCSKKYVSHDDKLKALVDRINSGKITDGDQHVLVALPHDALAIIEMSAAEWVVWHSDILDRI